MTWLHDWGFEPLVYKVRLPGHKRNLFWRNTENCDQAKKSTKEKTTEHQLTTQSTIELGATTPHHTQPCTDQTTICNRVPHCPTVNNTECKKNNFSVVLYLFFLISFETKNLKNSLSSIFFLIRCVSVRREYHIANLLQRFPNARIVAQDKSMVDVPLQLKNGQFLNFRV